MQKIVNNKITYLKRKNITPIIIKNIPKIFNNDKFSFQIKYPTKKAKLFVRAVVINQITVNLGEFE